VREWWRGKGIALNRHFTGTPTLPLKYSSISAAFSRFVAFFIASARSSPGGILRALSRASAAQMFSLQANDDWTRLTGQNERLA
jgi:hypothetical protein